MSYSSWLLALLASLVCVAVLLPPTLAHADIVPGHWGPSEPSESLEPLPRRLDGDIGLIGDLPPPEPDPAAGNASTWSPGLGAGIAALGLCLVAGLWWLGRRSSRPTA